MPLRQFSRLCSVVVLMSALIACDDDGPRPSSADTDGLDSLVIPAGGGPLERLLCAEPVLLVADTSGTGAARVRWLPQDLAGQSLVADTARLFLMETLNDSDSVLTRDSIRLRGQAELDIPTAFSPNSDGQNDNWHPFGRLDSTCIAEASVRVFDPAQDFKLLFEGSGLPPDTWQGRDQEGTPLPRGSYAYELAVRFRDGRRITTDGLVSLLR